MVKTVAKPAPAAPAPSPAAKAHAAVAKTAAERAKPAAPVPAKKTTTALATRPEAALVAGSMTQEMFAADVGAGMEGTTQESFAIPFLIVLQKGSPQVDEASGVALEGAKSGMFFETVTKRMFEGKDDDGEGGVLFIPCAYRRVFLRWGARGTDRAGFKGEIAPEVVAQMRARKELVEVDNHLFVPNPDGSIHEKKNDRVADTRNHYGLLLDPEEDTWMQVLVSLTSTQIKKSKNLMAALANVKIKGDQGLFVPPTFANVVRFTTVPESNDKGNWHGIIPDVIGRVTRPDLYAAAKAFHANVVKGNVEVKYEDLAADTVDADDGGNGGDAAEREAHKRGGGAAAGKF